MVEWVTWERKRRVRDLENGRVGVVDYQKITPDCALAVLLRNEHDITFDEHIITLSHYAQMAVGQDPLHPIFLPKTH